MRGQLGPYVIPGNSPALRRHARKPPPIILWSIGIFTCLLFMGSAAMLAVGYLNPFGTVGLSILGVGAVVHFLAIIFLVLSCLWVERKYPGMQPLSFKIYTKKPQRPPPTTFSNPNITGQVPSGTTPTYRMHSELSSNITGIGESKREMGKVPSDRKVTAENKNDKQTEKNMPNQRFSTAQKSVQDEDFDAFASKDKVPEATTQAETSNHNAIMSANNALKDGSNATPENLKAQNDDVGDTSVQTKNISEHSKKDNNMTLISSPQKDVKGKQKTHHFEIPPEDYPKPAHVPPVASDKQESSTEKSKDASQQRRKSMENNLLHNSVGISISTSTENKTTMQQQNYTHRNNVTQSCDTDLKSMEKESPSVHPSNTENGTSSENDQKAPDNSQRSTTLRSTPKKIQAQENKNAQDVSREKVTDLFCTDFTSPDGGGKPTLQVKQDTSEQLPKPRKNMDSAEVAKPSFVSDKKHESQIQKYHVQNPQSSMNLVKDNSKISSANPVSNAFHSKNDGSHENQIKELSNKSISTSSNHSAQNADLQGAIPAPNKYLDFPEMARKVESQEKVTRKQDSPERTKKQKPAERQKTVESPDRGRKLRHDYKLSHSPSNVKKTVSTSPKHRQRTPDVSPRAQRNKDHAVKNLSSDKEDLHWKLNSQSSPSSQSSDVPSSTSSSPPRRHKRMPDVSSRAPKHPIHSTTHTTFYPSAQKEEHNRHSQWSSPSSYSSDVSSSPPSSPRRQRQKSPDVFSKAQKHKDILSNAVLSSSTTKDELNKRLSQQSSQSSDSTLTFNTSPLAARKMVQNKSGQTQINKPTRSQHKDQQAEPSGAKSEYKQQVKHQRPHAPQSSSQTREMSPTAATNSPSTNKRFPPNLREDQT